MGETRTETDSFGPIKVPQERFWGAQTQRSLEHFRIGQERMPRPLIRALAMVKLAAAEANLEFGDLAPGLADAIGHAARSFHFRSGRPAPAPRPT